MASSSGSPSPPKDLDIFGKELGLNDGERLVLAEAGEVFLKKQLHVDSHSKKGDPTEPRALVLSSSRCYVLSQKPTAKVDVSFSFLKIMQIACSEKKISFQVGGEAKPREFHASKRDVVEIVALITAQLKNVFPITPLPLILKLTFDSEALGEETGNLRDNMLSSMDRVDATSVAGFMTSYGFICDFFGVPLSKEVSWYMHNVYLAHGFRDLKLADFDHLSTREILPMLSTLRHNQFFEGLVEKDARMMPELFDELSYVLNSSHALKKIVLSSCGMRPENLIRLSVSLKNNPRTALTHLDVSDNLMDDKAIECLATALETLPHGLQELNLANCKITPKSGSHLANCMKQNKHMEYSLVSLDLSGNPLGPDPHGALAFLQEPQTIATLNLSKCNLSFEFVIPVLNRGCQQHLRVLNLSQNAGKSKKGIHGPTTASTLQQFCSSAISIETIRLAECKLTGDAVSGLLEGLAVNPNLASVELDVSINDLSVGRDPANLPKVLARSKNLRRLNLSESGLDNLLPNVVAAVAGNPAIKHLAIGKNFGGKQVARQAALEKLAALLMRDDCHLESLCLNDSRLKELSTLILGSVAMNNSLLKLSIGGNQMGNRGARCLAKALLTNCTLQELEWDHNETTLYGFQDVADSLQHNSTLRVMPLPLFDVARGGRPVEHTVQRIQALLSRNHSDERLKVELAARHRGRLLSTTQQSAVVSRELVQLEDLLKWAESVYEKTHPVIVEGQEVKEQANNVVVLTDGLYSPQVESEQFEAVTKQVKRLLDTFVNKVFEDHVKANTDRMVGQSDRACSKLLSPDASSALKDIAATELSKDLAHAKKAVRQKMAPELINHVSAVNLDTAASISELVVEQTLAQLDKINGKLIKMQKAARSNSTTPDTRVSRNFTFRVQQEEPVKKKRSRRPDTDEEDVVLPSQPLETDGPALQHPGKARPKPARMQRPRAAGPRKPSLKDTPVKEEAPETITEATDEGPKELVASLSDKKEAKPKEAMLPPAEKAKKDKSDSHPLTPPEDEVTKAEAVNSLPEENKSKETEPVAVSPPADEPVAPSSSDDGGIKMADDSPPAEDKGAKESSVVDREEPKEKEAPQQDELPTPETTATEKDEQKSPPSSPELEVSSEQSQASEEKSEEVKVVPSPSPDVIEVGLVKEEEGVDVAPPSAAPAAAGLPAEKDKEEAQQREEEDQREEDTATIEPPPPQAAPTENLSPSPAQTDGVSPPENSVSPPAAVLPSESPSASPRPMPKPRVAKPSQPDAEHKELVQSTEERVNTPDITIDSGSPAKTAAVEKEEEVPAAATPVKADDGKKKKPKKGKSVDDRPLTPSAESEEKGERRPSKDKRRSGFAKLFGKSKKEEASERDKPASQRMSVDWEVLGSPEAAAPHKEPSTEHKPSPGTSKKPTPDTSKKPTPDVSPKPRPPMIKEKPRRAASLDMEQLMQEPEAEKKGPPVGGIPTANMSELANVLKRGRGTQLRPTKPAAGSSTEPQSPPPAAAAAIPEDPSSIPAAVKRSPGGPPKPKPKPRPTKKFPAPAPTTGEQSEGPPQQQQQQQQQTEPVDSADGTLV